ncbi:hypothetical protein PMAYCL1PPCAC_09726, partial [Pristionchus mayeri]
LQDHCRRFMLSSKCMLILLCASAGTTLFFIISPYQACVPNGPGSLYITKRDALGDDDNATDSKGENTKPATFTEDLIDYSRCSPLKPLRIYVHPFEHPFAQALADHPAATEDEQRACLFIAFSNTESPALPSTWNSLGEPGINHVIVNLNDDVSITPRGNEMIVQARFENGAFRSNQDFSLSPDVATFVNTTWQNRPSIMPLKRPIDYSLVVDLPDTKDSKIPEVHCVGDCSSSLLASFYCFLPPSGNFHSRLLSSLRAACIPVVLSTTQRLPFQDHLDWRLASFRFAKSMLPHIPEILEELEKEDVMELRRRGKVFLARLDDAQALSKSLVAALSERVQVNLELYPEVEANLIAPNNKFSNITFKALRIQSLTGKQKFTANNMYSRARWNSGRDLTYTPRSVHDAPPMPGDAAMYEGTRENLIGSSRLGLSIDADQFTVIILTYNRDNGVRKIIESLRDCPHLNKIIIVWNNLERRPNGTWPEIHVPVEFILAERNSLISRFLPYDRIQTDAVVSMDDDTGLGQPELTFAFRMWRENRDRIVGFPERVHKAHNGKLTYAISGLCQYSLVLTGFALMHKEFLYEFVYNQHPTILDHIHNHRNCEDIAMNFLIAHLTRRPPLRVIKKKSMSNGSRAGLSARGGHYTRRSECIQMFTQLYGYNPLLFSQELARPNGNCVAGL